MTFVDRANAVRVPLGDTRLWWDPSINATRCSCCDEVVPWVEPVSRGVLTHDAMIWFQCERTSAKPT